MNEKSIKKFLGFLKYEWTLVFLGIIIFLSLLTVMLVHTDIIAVDASQLKLFFELGAIAATVSSIISIALIFKFRARIEQLYDTIKSVADGDFVVAVNTKDNSADSLVYKNLSRVVDELKGSKEEMQQFTNEFLHEIKTPITAIHGFAEYLVETGQETESPERMRYLQIISDESIRLADLSQKTLLLAKLDACQIVTDKQTFDLGEQIKRCTILLLSQIEKKHIELDMDVEGLTYYGNAEFMEQMWLNLIGNAIKFTPDYGEISIRGITKESGITLSITDSGPGMDEETRTHIFEKYYQGTSGRKAGGNGIGLSIVHRIVNLCGGTIEVTSWENVGSTFTVFLPSNTIQNNKFQPGRILSG